MATVRFPPLLELGPTTAHSIGGGVMQSVLIAVGPRQAAQDLAIPFQEWRHHAFNGF